MGSQALRNTCGVISVCRVHVFFHKYVANIREEKLENVLRTFAASPFIFDMAVSSTSGVIATPPESSAGEVLPLNTGHQSFSLLSLLILTLPRKPVKVSSSSLSIDRFQPLRGKTSPPPGEALLPPPADDCLIPDFDDPNTAVLREPFPWSEPPCSLPAYVMVWAVPSAGPSGASDWVGFQDLYVSARDIFDLCDARDPGGRRVTTAWTAESFMQILGVRRSAVFRWKPGLRIAAASYSGPGRRKMSGVAPAPVLVCRSLTHYVYVCCFGGIEVGVIV